MIRLSWLYGIHGKSFARTILERAPRQKHFEVVSDQVGRPTYTRDLTAALAGLLKRDPDIFEKNNQEIFHFGNDGTVSWADFAAHILKTAAYDDAMVTAIPSTRLDRPAKRPHNSVLSLQKTRGRLGVHLRPWQDAFLDFLHEFREAV